MCSWPPCCHGVILILIRLVSLGKAQKAPKSKKCLGRAAVGGSVEGTSGPRDEGIWSG